MSTLTFQPEATRYYAEGYWRPGDLWSDFAARADAVPDKVALILDDRQVTYAELRRAAVALSARLAAGGVHAGDVVILLGRHSIEAAIAMLGALHRGAVLAPLPPMFNVGQLAALAAQTDARAVVCFGDERELAKADHVAGQVPLVLALDSGTAGRTARHRAPRASRRARRGRHRDRDALVGHDVGSEGDRALEQHAALRDRGDLQALGALRRGRLPRRVRVRLRGRARLRLLPGAPHRRHGGAREPLEARGRAAPDRGAPMLVRAADADPCRRHAAGRGGDRAGPLEHARARRSRAHPGAPHGHEGGVRRRAAGRLRPVRGPGARGARPARARGQDGQDGGAPV